MSDNPTIQTSPEPQGGAVDLSTDANTGRKRGTDVDQNSLSFSRGTEVPASSSDVASRNSLNNGAGVTGVAVSVQQTSHRAIEGSNAPNDFRKSGDTAAASLAKAADNGGPRQPAGQFANGKNCR